MAIVSYAQGSQIVFCRGPLEQLDRSYPPANAESEQQRRAEYDVLPAVYRSHNANTHAQNFQDESCCSMGMQNLHQDYFSPNNLQRMRDLSLGGQTIV
jgi:hypothetical protein